MPEEMSIKFWGVRGSYPTPGPGTVKYGGNTASVEIRAGERTILLDAGTGIIPLGRDLVKRKSHEMILLFSHLHHDHTQGFPFFMPAYLADTKLHIFGPDGTHESLQNVLEHNQSSETFPVRLREMASTKKIRSVCETHVIVWDETGVRLTELTAVSDPDAVVIHIHKSYAHPGGVLAYRVAWRGRSVVYATDTEGYIGTDQRLAAFARDADLLIHDAQYQDEHYWGQKTGFNSTQGYGHSTVTMACDLAASAQVGQLILFHHDPSYSDPVLDEMQAYAKERFPGSQTAYERLEISLPVENKITERLQSSVPELGDVKYANHD